MSKPNFIEGYIKTDTHYYDPYISSYFNKIIKYLPSLSKEEIKNEWIEIFNFSKDIDSELRKRDIRSFYEYSVNKVMNDTDDFDGNIKYSCLKLGAQTWNLIKNNRDAITLFMEQFKDMYLTNGWCVNGRSNRYIQILIAFKEELTRVAG